MVWHCAQCDYHTVIFDRALEHQKATGHKFDSEKEVKDFFSRFGIQA